ncbi:hypothetical protein [Rubritalea tangerina]
MIKKSQMTVQFAQTKTQNRQRDTFSLAIWMRVELPTFSSHIGKLLPPPT